MRQCASLAILLLASSLAWGQKPPTSVIGSGLPITSSLEGSGWFSADSVLWWYKDAPLPQPLVTVANANGGFIGNPTTRESLGGPLYNGLRAGARLEVGTWFDDVGCLGGELSFLVLNSQAVKRNYGVSALDGTSLSLPFIDATANNEVAFVTAFPVDPALGVGANGTVSFSYRTALWGMEANSLWKVHCCNGLRFDLLAGFRYLHLSEDLTLTTTSRLFPLIPGDVFATSDRFATRNDFCGGQVGGRVFWECGCLTVSAKGMVAAGTTMEVLRVDGVLATTLFNNFTLPVQYFPGGLFAQRSNIGHSATRRFAVLPEGNVQIGIRLTEFLLVRVGYSFLYISDVARAGSQIDRRINPTQSEALTGMSPPPFSGPSLPARIIHHEDFWAHGLNVGLDFRF